MDKGFSTHIIRKIALLARIYPPDARTTFYARLDEKVGQAHKYVLFLMVIDIAFSSLFLCSYVFLFPIMLVLLASTMIGFFVLLFVAPFVPIDELVSYFKGRILVLGCTFLEYKAAQPSNISGATYAVEWGTHWVTYALLHPCNTTL